MRLFFVSLIAGTLAPAALAADIQVSFSDKFQQELEDNYGPREGERLADDIRDDLEHELSKANINPARVSVTIVNAKPNRPTQQQMSDEPGLDMLRSKSIGGMDLTGTAYDDAGNPIGELQYDWFETSIDNVHASGVWGDANRASRRFARKFADSLSN